MVRRQQAADRAVRPPMRSPGTPPHAREVQRLFWIEIAKGLIPAQAAIAVGGSQPVGQRWFHNAGGMPPFHLEPLSGRYLSFSEREEIAILHAQGAGVRQIARAIGRDPSTVSRELRRTPPRVDTDPTTVRRSGSGRRTWLPSARRSRSWSPTRGCAPTSRTSSAGRSPGPMARWFPVRRHRASRGTTSPTARTGPGRWRGARSRSRTGSGLTSPMMSP